MSNTRRKPTGQKAKRVSNTALIKRIRELTGAGDDNALALTVINGVFEDDSGESSPQPPAQPFLILTLSVDPVAGTSTLVTSLGAPQHNAIPYSQQLAHALNAIKKADLQVTQAMIDHAQAKSATPAPGKDKDTNDNQQPDGSVNSDGEGGGN